MQAGVLQKTSDQAACMFEGQGSTPRGLFWLAFDWCKQVTQVARSP